MKYLEKAYLHRQKADEWLPGLWMGTGDEDAPKLDCGDCCTVL